MTLRRRYRTAAAFVLSALALAASAQTPAPAEKAAAKAEPAPAQPAAKSPGLMDLDLEALSKVQVRPTATAMAGASVASSVSTGSGTTVTPSQLDLAQQGSTGQLLERAAGVSVRRISSLSLDPRVRGFHSGQTNASADGMTQYRTRIDIDSLFSQIDAGNVESLTVVNGPYSSLYGPGFAFIAVDLIKPKRYETPEAHWSSLFSYGYNGAPLYHRDRVWGGGQDYGFDLSYGLRTGNDYRSGDLHGERIPASYNQQDLYSAFSFDLDRNQRLDFQYLRVGLRNTELPGVAYDIVRQTTDQFNLRWSMRDDPTGPDRLLAQFWFHQTPFVGNAERESKQRSFFNAIYGTSFPDVQGGNLTGAGLSRTFGTRVLYTAGDRESLAWTVGADWRYLAQNYREEDFTAAGTLSFGGDIFGIPHSDQHDFGLLTHVDLRVGEQSKATLGGRLDRVRTRLDLGDEILLTPPTDPTLYYRAGTNQPSFGLAMLYGTYEVQTTERVTVAAGIGFASRAPNLVELYNDEAAQPLLRFGNNFTDANSFLDAEKNLQLDLGVKYNEERFKAGVRGFHSTIYDYIQAVPSTFSNFVPSGLQAPTNLLRNYSAFASDPDDSDFDYGSSTAALAYRYTNVKRVTIAGAEATLEVPLDKWLTLDTSLAYVKGTNHVPVRFLDATQELVPIKGAEALPGIYPFNATVRLRAVEPEQQKWGMEGVLRMVNGQRYVAESFGELATSGFTTVDVHGYYQMTPHLRLFGSVQNLFNRDYTEHGSLVISNLSGTSLRFVPEKGIAVSAGVEARY